VNILIYAGSPEHFLLLPVERLPHLKPEPLHHDQRVLAIGIILVDAKHRAVSHALVEPLRPYIGDPYFQLDTGGKLKGELVFGPADKELADPPVPVPRTDADIAKVPVDIFPGVLKAAHDKPGNSPVAYRHEIGGRVIRKGFHENGLVPRIGKRLVLDRDNRGDIRESSVPYLWQGIRNEIVGADHEGFPVSLSTNILKRWNDKSFGILPWMRVMGNIWDHILCYEQSGDSL
jgi:hypothetical protein